MDMASAVTARDPQIHLTENGAKLLSVVPSSCTARGGRVLSGEQTISYGEIVRRGNLDRR